MIPCQYFPPGPEDRKNRFFAKNTDREPGEKQIIKEVSGESLSLLLHYACSKRFRKRSRIKMILRSLGIVLLKGL